MVAATNDSHDAALPALRRVDWGWGVAWLLGIGVVGCKCLRDTPGISTYRATVNNRSCGFGMRPFARRIDK